MQRIVLIAVALATASCSKGNSTAMATFEPRSGSQVTGTATFKQASANVEIVVEAKSLPPGKHAVNIHEKGDCTGSNASAVGPRFSPGGDAKAGLLGELDVGASGEATLKVTSSALTVAPGDRSVMGRSIVISSDPQNAGSTVTFGIISCGVIEASK